MHVLWQPSCHQFARRCKKRNWNNFLHYNETNKASWVKKEWWKNAFWFSYMKYYCGWSVSRVSKKQSCSTKKVKSWMMFTSISWNTTLHIHCSTFPSHFLFAFYCSTSYLIKKKLFNALFVVVYFWYTPVFLCWF